MRLSVRSWSGQAAIAAAVISVVVATAGTVPAQARPDAPGAGAKKSPTVMPRNLYLGVDIQRPIAATAGKPVPRPSSRSAIDRRCARSSTRRTLRESRTAGQEIARQQARSRRPSKGRLWRSGPIELPPPYGTRPGRPTRPRSTRIS